MPKYPTMDQYNEVVQHPKTAFSDAVLQHSKIKTNAMGLPFALGGGFALTYTATTGTKKFAVRCFHKEARELEVRYGKIDSALAGLSSKYFVGFEYQNTGVLVNGNRFPVVKMDWVDGDTLGVYLEDYYNDRAHIEKLLTQFSELEAFLRSNGVAHGDLQNGNLIVKDDVRLIDYDGMFVPGMQAGKGTELGHKHFQHPGRTAADFGPEMDRFSFISINLNLRAMAAQPMLFDKYSSGENIILTASDYANPAASPAMSEMKSIPALARDVENFAKICSAPIRSVPTPTDFLSGLNIPSAAVVISTKSQVAKFPLPVAAYVPAYSVVDASDYIAVESQIGNVIELIGKVLKVYSGKTKYGKPFHFVFFGGGISVVKLNIWSNTELQGLGSPGQSWVGQYLSITGLVDPVYSSSKYGDSISITPSTKNSAKKISVAEAKKRLSARFPNSPIPVVTASTNSNSAILDSIRGTPLLGKPNTVNGANKSAPMPTAKSLGSRNQQLLSGIKATAQSSPIRTTQLPTQNNIKPVTNKSSSEIGIGKIAFWVALGLIVLAFIAG
tara:strand:- start:255 stop:1922 length:1668 start_codon:yes stop_codon:yes gene_type:complete